MSDNDDWRKTFASLRATCDAAEKKNTQKLARKRIHKITAQDHGLEALMTLVAIMKDESDPRLQITAAKALLERSEQSGMPSPVEPLSPDEIDAAIALAKAVLDELAARKAGSVAGTSGMAAAGAAEPDHA